MISIVTITFNNYEELIKTLSSIEGIRCAESIVINGGSCERTREFLKQYHGIPITEPDRGISDAFNKGLSLSTGDAVMFLNSGDVLLDKEYIYWANSIFESMPETDYTFSDIIFDDSDLGPVNVLVHNSEKRSMARGMPYPHQSLIIRKKIFAKIGNFDESFRLAMDFDLVLRMKKDNAKGKHYSKPTVLMDGNGVSSKNDFKAIKETYKAIKKNNQLSLRILLRLLLSWQIYFTKMVLSFLGLKFILNYIKKKRYGI